MWPDNETDRDFLNFSGVASTVAEIIIQTEGRPVSIGVSGAWGVGKSSMLKLIRQSLEGRVADDSQPEFVFVEFNAWLYQGYDDARAALMDAIVRTLESEAKKREKGLDTVQQLIDRIDWLRIAKLAAGTLIPMALGLPPGGLVGSVIGLVKGLGAKKTTTSDVEETGMQLAGTAAGLLKSDPDSSPPKEIDAIRRYFEESLEEIGIRLVVLIDDLDRCLPVTTISTLEAIRLFLFLKNTAFVIAADESMIRHAVGQHFEGLGDEDLITNYFDKLIQIPIRVPPLGTQEVRAYMMLLFIEQSSLQENEKETLRERICEQLGQTWQGKRVDRAFVTSLREEWPDGLLARFDAADRLAPIMATASRIAGNPRLVKRFLNALSIRISIARAQGVDIDETVLAKMLLFERCGSSKAYAELAANVSQSADGKPEFLREWELQAAAGEPPELDEPWGGDFEAEWLALSPTLADKDLRGILYVSREHAPIITPEDRLSSDAAEVLRALLEHPDMAQDLVASLGKIPRPELQTIMDRLLERARKEQEWGTPDILDACLVVADVDPTSASRFAAFLRERPVAQIRASIVQRIADKQWAGEIFESWEKSGRLSGPVKKAIAHGMKNGNV